jgi:DnaJ-class molecular chaperone
MSRTHYQVLGVDQGAETEEIRAAYRRLAKSLHPDINRAPDATEQFKALQVAHEVLSNRRSRDEYDYSLMLDDKTVERINREQSDYGIEVYTPKKRREKKPKEKKFRKANVDFEEIPEGFVKDNFSNGGII